MAEVLSKTRCTLGEGALWHPKRQSLFWCDILNHRLYEHTGQSQRYWTLDRAVSAAGWIDNDTLLLATERDLVRFDLRTGAETVLLPLEADRPGTRSNDGRADPQGGFWIGTMGYGAEPGAGAIYRYHRGTLRRLYNGLTIPNAISFAPDGRSACFTDTTTRRVMRVGLDPAGWPRGAPELWLDLNETGHPEGGYNPDGAVLDSEGRFWSAQWGASRIACYDPGGTFVRAIPFPTGQISCPAFGGPTLSRLFATSAAEGLSDDDLSAGQTFFMDLEDATGQAEHQVIL